MINEKIINEVTVAVRDYLPADIKEDVSVYVENIVKDNDIVLHGLIIKNRNNNFAPTIYLENYINLFEHNVPMSEIAKIIFCEYSASVDNIPDNLTFISSPDFEVSEMVDFLEIQLVNTDMNKKRMKDSVHREVNAEFSLLVYIVITDRSGESYRTLFRKDFLKNSKFTEADIVDIALNNTALKRKPVLTEMENIVEGFNIAHDNYFSEEFLKNNSEGMYILTNEDMHFGATVLYYIDMMKKIGEILDNNYYAIPSSVHEFIIIPESDLFPVNGLISLLHEANDTILENGEFLSNNVYKYDVSQGNLTEVKIS